jgi:hypothetical protein
MVYERPTYRSLPPREAPARRAISLQQAQDVAFRLSQDRGLRVTRVTQAQVDSAGRWHVTLEGDAGDRAALLLDGRDGKLLKGRFRQRSAAQPAPPPPASAQPQPPSPASPGGDEPPPPPPPPPHDQLDELD